MVALRPEICAGVWQAIFDIEAKLASGDPHFREGPEQTIDLAERALRNSRSSNRRRQSVWVGCLRTMSARFWASIQNYHSRAVRRRSAASAFN